MVFCLIFSMFTISNPKMVEAKGFNPGKATVTGIQNGLKVNFYNASEVATWVVYYSTSKKFNNNTPRVATFLSKSFIDQSNSRGYSGGTLYINGLKANKTYYVRIEAYDYINGSPTVKKINKTYKVKTGKPNKLKDGEYHTSFSWSNTKTFCKKIKRPGVKRVYIYRNYIYLDGSFSKYNPKTGKENSPCSYKYRVYKIAKNCKIFGYDGQLFEFSKKELNRMNTESFGFDMSFIIKNNSVTKIFLYS